MYVFSFAFIVKISFLSRLLFVAPFTFHRQYFQAIWRGLVENVNCVYRNIAYAWSSLCFFGRKMKSPPRNTTRFHRIFFFFHFNSLSFFALFLFTWIEKMHVFRWEQRQAEEEKKYSYTCSQITFWNRKMFFISLSFFILFNLHLCANAASSSFSTQSWNLFFVFAKE